MMGIQNVAAIFCIPLISPLLGYKIWQPHSVSPKGSKGGYRIWQAYRIWRYPVWVKIYSFILSSLWLLRYILLYCPFSIELVFMNKW